MELATLFTMNKYKCIWVILLTFFFISACSNDTTISENNNQSHTPIIFAENNISFICPTEWAITENVTQGISHYVACEKQPDIGNSGLIIVEWVDSEMNKSEIFSIQKSTLEETWNGHDIKIDFSEPEEFTFKGYPALKTSYSFSLMSLEHQSIMVVLNCNNKSIIIMFQEAGEDHNKNKKGYEEFQNSFTC